MFSEVVVGVITLLFPSSFISFPPAQIEASSVTPTPASFRLFVPYLCTLSIFPMVSFYVSGSAVIPDHVLTLEILYLGASFRRENVMFVFLDLDYLTQYDFC